MNNKIYNIIYSKLTQWLTPAMLRKPITTAWLSVCISPVVFIYNNLLRFRTLKLYQLGITPQVCSLQKLLNDKYDFFRRGIQIQDATEYDPLYIFTEEEDKPVFMFTSAELSPVYIYTDGEVGSIINDFIVVVPYYVSFNMDEMFSLVKTYKLASKQFQIIQQ